MLAWLVVVVGTDQKNDPLKATQSGSDSSSPGLPVQCVQTKMKEDVASSAARGVVVEVRTVGGLPSPPHEG